MGTLLALASMTPTKCGVPPFPVVAKFALAGLAFIHSISAFTLVTSAGTAGPTLTTSEDFVTGATGMKSLIESYSSFLKICGNRVMGKSVVNSIVAPSGAACLTKSTAGRELAPVLLSTITTEA